MPNNFVQRIQTFFVNYFTLTPFLVPQADAEASIREGVSFRGTNIFILIFAILIASLGLNTNSTAVIIGAMLISPLMGPIIGIGLGVGIHDFPLVKKALRNLIMAAGFSVIASTFYFLISPVHEGHSELLARTSPSIYDVLIAFFGGMAGIIGIGSSNKGNVIPGVAIATALMPPLCTAGYGLATLQLHYFFGAFYLFLINSIFIAFATMIGTKIMKYHMVEISDPIRAQKVRRTAYMIVVVTMLPSIYLTYTMFRQSQYMNDVRTFINRTMKFPDTQVLSYTVDTDNGEKQLNITLIGRILPTDSLKMALASRLDDFGLKNTRLNFIQGDMRSSADDVNASSIKDIYQISQATITHQQEVIDSLRALNAQRACNDTISATLAPELRVLFPQVSEISVSQSIFTNTESSRLDTVTVALVRYSAKMPAATQDKMREYLEARLRLR
ncbi:MAG: TIGR00341 family protein, partial [Muribaculaceae bacterium]|nr:TIGR00341 family protein [Muribaculaceae bacterium]